MEVELYHHTLRKEARDSAYSKALASYHKVKPEVKFSEFEKDYSLIFALPERNTKLVSNKISAFTALAKKTAAKNQNVEEIRCLLQVFQLSFWSAYPNYDLAFQTAIQLERKLPIVSENEYPNKRDAYFKLGEAYYLFKDFNKSIILMDKAITDKPPHSFSDTANLKARLIAGVCHANLGYMEVARNYFISVLESKDLVLNRPVHNAMALSYLACRSMLLGEYQKALDLDVEVLDFLKTTNNYGHLAGMYACNCFSYFGLGKADKVSEIADSVLLYAKKDTYNKDKRLKQAYDILNHYYTYKNDVSKALLYRDSLIGIYQKEEMLYSSRYILRAQQDLDANEIRTQKELVHRNYHAIFTLVLILCILSIATFIILLQYRRLRAAYRILVVKNNQWATDQSLSDLSANQEQNLKLEEGKKENEEMAIKLQDFMNHKKPYMDPELDLDTFSDIINIPRHKLSTFVNQYYAKNFNQYINEFRVKEAIRLLSSKEFHYLSINDIMIKSGFNGRSSFYQIFKNHTGLTPGEYRKNQYEAHPFYKNYTGTDL